MTIRYENTLPDAIAYNEFCHFHTPQLRRNNRRTLLVIPLLAVSVMFLLSRLMIGRALTWSTLVSLCIGAILLFAAQPYLLRFSIRSRVKYMTKIGAYKAFLGQHSLLLAPDGLRSVSPVGESRCHWDAITEVRRSETQIFLFMSETAALPVPRRAFTDAAHEAAFLTQIERYRAGAVAVPAVASATRTTPATQISNDSVSNAPWWSGQTASSVGTDAQANVAQRNN